MPYMNFLNPWEKKGFRSSLYHPINTCKINMLILENVRSLPLYKLLKKGFYFQLLLFRTIQISTMLMKQVNVIRHNLVSIYTTAPISPCFNMWHASSFSFFCISKEIKPNYINMFVTGIKSWMCMKVCYIIFNFFFFSLWINIAF